MNRNLGVFEVPSFALIDPEEMLAVLSMLEFVPVRVEHHYMNDVMEYIGMSHKFDLLAEGEKAPTYSISVTKDEDGAITNVEAKRVERHRPSVALGIAVERDEQSAKD